MASKEQYKQTKQKQTPRYREQTYGCQREGVGGLGQGEGTDKYRLVIIKQSWG